jgi:hypothetical protein
LHLCLKLPERKIGRDWGVEIKEIEEGKGMVIEVVVGKVEYVQGRESCLFPKLDLPLFKGFLFLFIFHQNEARVGGWDFSTSQVYHITDNNYNTLATTTISWQKTIIPWMA